MTKVTMKNGQFALAITKRLGRPMLYGWTMFGWSQFGEEIEQCGVYQKRYVQTKYVELGDKLRGRSYICKMRPCWPTNVYHANRQAWRAVFAGGIAAWQALTTPQKNEYRHRATRRGKRGFDLFMSEYMKEQS
ncbi:MAG: hypothetical protein WC554_10840 [Clostridia bacterium]|jgi:hypothetical protein